MLLLEPARRRSAARSKVALALAGGGPLGAFFEIGALHAMSEAIQGLDFTQLDVYTGVSSGALIAAGLANGFDTATLTSAFIDDQSAELSFTPAILLQPAIAEFVRRVGGIPAKLVRAARQYVREPGGDAWSAAVASFGGMLPTALFDNRPLESYLRTLFNLPGHTDDFRRLKSRLYVVATDLDTTESVHFGGPGTDDVPISRAVLASAALPGLYPPVKIGNRHFVDGALVRTMNASLALEEGCNLLICVNPLVPFDASAVGKRPRLSIADHGLPTLLSQTFRSLIYSRMAVGRASYRLRYPRADQLLLEPDRTDERLFFTNVFRYAERRRLAEHAYQCTRRDLLAQAPMLGRLLARHGFRLDLKVLRDRHRTHVTAAKERGERTHRATGELDRALTRLQRVLAPRRRG